jgi:hypothetical protein
MIQKNLHLAKAAIVLLMIVTGFKASAQDWKSDERINVMFGLTQPVLASGFNIEGNFIYDRFIFDYSHGVSLDFKDGSTTSSLRQQGVAVHMPYTTGFGLGYRITEWLNIRVEPKWHRFEFYYEDQPQTKSNQITAYNTFSLGAGYFNKNTNSNQEITKLDPGILFTPLVINLSVGYTFGIKKHHPTSIN